MRIDPEHSSRWMADFEKALQRCRQPILHGNVLDQFLLNGGYTTVLEFLRAYLQEAGYAIVGQYDVADGLVFATPEMRSAFERIVSGRLLGPDRRPAAPSAPEATPSAPTATGPGPATPEPPGAVPPARAIPGRAGPPRPFLQDPLEAVSQIRIVLGQSQVPAAFVLRCADNINTARENNPVPGGMGKAPKHRGGCGGV